MKKIRKTTGFLTNSWRIEKPWRAFNGGYPPEDLELASRRDKIHLFRSEGDAGMKTLALIWVDTDKSVGFDTQEHSIEVVCKRIHNEEAR